MRLEEFVGSLVGVSAGLQATHQEVLNDWDPEVPPVTTLFSAFGDRIAEDFDGASSDVRRQTFALIENAMESGDSVLVTAVATGLIESLVTRATRAEELWDRLAPHLGPKSLSHAKAWLTA